MHPIPRHRPLTSFAPIVGLLLLAGFAAGRAAEAPRTEPPPPAKYPDFPSDTPAKFELPTDSFDYVKREVMIPMRDEVKLNTVILVPRGARGAPILLTRTPLGHVHK